MGDDIKTTPPQSEIPSGEIPVYYTKSNYYRVIHADGIYGGGTPTLGNIMMTVFSHRVPLPEKTANDACGKEIVAKRMARYGIEQEFEASLVMSLEMAKVMQQWLGNAIKNTEIALQQAQPQNQKK